MNSLIQRFQSIDIRLCAILISCLFSLINIMGNPIPNDDAFSYLKAAELFSAQGLDAILSTYGWYGYSILIALINSLIPIGLINSAHLFNTFALAFLVYAFITLVMEYRQNIEVRFFAAIVILCFPTINEMRYYLIRDFAFWALCLIALAQLIRFNKYHKPVHACYWFLAMAGAVFFRMEGLIILAISPFALLMPGAAAMKVRSRFFLTLLVLALAGVVLILVLFFLIGVNLFEVFNYTFRWYLPLLVNYPETLIGAAENISVSEHISDLLLPFAGKGLFVLFFGYCLYVLGNLFITLGPIASLFLTYCFYSGRFSLHKTDKWPWLYFLGSSLLALMIFVSIMQFLTTRYTVMTALLLLTLIPLCMESLYVQAQQTGREKLFSWIFAFYVLFFTTDSLISFGYSKSYIEDAIVWSQDNIEMESKLQTNHYAIAYYSGLITDYDKIEKDPGAILSMLAEYDYLMLDLRHDDALTRQRLEQYSGLTELIRFCNKRDDAIVIFRIASQF